MMGPNKYDDNDPDQFRMYRELAVKERTRLGRRIWALEEKNEWYKRALKDIVALRHTKIIQNIIDVAEQALK